MCTLRVRHRQLREERGFALMDAVWSVLIIALAFSATFAVLEQSSKSAARDAKRSQALVLAQNELNRMRNIGQRSESQLLAMNSTTQTVAFRGQEYTVTYTAFPATGIGATGVGACSANFGSVSESTSMPDDNAFIYMQVEVSASAGATGSTGTNAISPISLDSWFAAERGNDMSSTVGMLRVYVLDRDDNPASSVSGVTMRAGGVAPDIQPIASDSTNGCFLFADLAAGAYQIRVGTTLQDVYMSNAGSLVTSNYTMPTGVLRSTAIRLSTPVKVTPSYSYMNGTAQTLDTTNSSVNRFVMGAEGSGNWVALSDDITKAQGNYFIAPGGVYMPNNLSGDADKSKLFPTLNGYKGFAGTCQSNSPGTNNWISVPASLPNASWAPGGTLSPNPVFWLTLMRPTASVTAGPGKPAEPGTWGAIFGANPQGNTGAERWVNWGHSFGSAKVQVALTGGPDGSGAVGSCRSGYSYTHSTQKWVRLPGTISTNGGGLTDVADALPPGRYDMCTQITNGFSKQKQKVVVTSTFLGIPTSFGWRYQGAPESASLSGARLTMNKILGFQAAPLAAPETFIADTDRYTDNGLVAQANTGCGDSAKWSG